MTPPCPDPIVITGASAVCALGLNLDVIAAALRSGHDGFGPAPALEQGGSGPLAAAQAPPLPDDFRPDLPREARYLRHVTTAAWSAADPDGQRRLKPDRCAAIFGTTLHGMRALGRYFRGRHVDELRHFLAPSLLRPAIDGLGIEGMAITLSSACASGLSTILLAADLLGTGRFDRVICGGYDPLSEYSQAGFQSLQLLAGGRPKPFSRRRDGLKLGEGYAALVLERAVDAERDGLVPLSRLLGGGESSDAHHLTQPDPAGLGAVRAARNALRRAGLEPSDLDAVFAHATATPDNDGAESAALRALFGPDLRRLAVTALKSRFGHCLGGAGAVELAVAIDALRRGSIPATHGVEAADLEFADVPLTIAGPGAIRPRASLSMSLGFGGANAAVILGPPDRPPPARPPIRRDPLRAVHITGMGTIVPGAIGLEALARLRAQGRKIDGSPPPPLDESLLEPHLAAARRTRRMALYSRLTLAATSMALAQAGLTSPDDRAETAAILGATHGALGYCCDYYRRIVREGMAGANPMLFAEGVPNVAAAHLTMTFGLKSGGWTILGSRTAALEAVALAFDRIAGGLAERIIVGAAEERVDELDAVYRAMDPWSLPAGYGAASIVLESEGSMARRGAASLGIVESAMTAAADRLPAAGAPVGGDRPHELFCVQPLIDLATALIGAVRASSPITVRADDPHGLSAAVHVRLSDR